MRLAPVYILISGLLTACSSQIVAIPTDSDPVSTTTVDVQLQKDRATLRGEGYGFFSSKVFNTRYRIDEADMQQVFAPSQEVQKEILAAGLPELPHSYMVQLSSDRGPQGVLTFDSLDGTRHQELDQIAQPAYIDGYPDQPKPIDKQRLQRDFGLTLQALDETLKAQRSYLILLESPDGEASKVMFHGRGNATLLDRTGQGITLDGLPYDFEKALADKDFGASRDSTREILTQGLPKLPHSYAAILENPIGPTDSAEILEGMAQGVVLDQPNQAVIIDGYSNKIFKLEHDRFQQDFAETTLAIPPLPVTITLYFNSGSAQLTRDSRALLPGILDEIRKHPAADISVNGYTDTVNSDRFNERLSQKRSEAVAALIRKSGVPFHQLALNAYGQDLPIVKTPEETSEQMNRRVEISIR